MSRRRLWLLRLAAVVLAPVLTLAAAEAGLRVAGYGYSTAFFKKVDGQDAYTGNPRFGWRFFPRLQSREPVLFRLPAKKEAGACRIFILGSSAAMGTPDPAYSFGRFLEVMLREGYPGVKFEVVNAGMTAINSHAVLPIARECAAHEPDLFIVYMGNNEIVGPYGPGTAFRGFSPSRTLIQASLWVRSTRTGELAESLLGSRETGGTEWQGMQMFLDHLVPADDPRLTTTYAHFEANLADLCAAGARAGAKTVVCSVAVNLKDCAPFASVHRSGLTEARRAEWEKSYQAGTELEKAGKHAEALQQYLAAAEIDNQFAELPFRLGRCYLAQGKSEEARKAFALARDLDALRFRADSRINDIIRRTAAGKEPQGLVLVDAERALAEGADSAQGIAGEELFFEHVHLKPQGNYLLAREVFAKVAALLPESVRSRGIGSQPPSQAECEARLALTPWDRMRLVKEMLDLTNKPPFLAQTNHADRREHLLRQWHELAQALQTQGGAAASTALYRKAVEADGDDVLLRQSFAQFLTATGDPAGALEQYEAILRQLPDSGEILADSAGPLAAMKRFDEAEGRFQQAVGLVANLSSAYNLFGLACFRVGRPDMAAVFHRESLRIAPNNATVQCDLAQALAEDNQFNEALAVLTRTAEARPTRPDIQILLGLIYRKCGNLDQAAGHLARAVELDAYSSDAHKYLAEVMIEKGLKPEVIKHLHDAAYLDPYDAQARRRYAQFLHLYGQFGEAAHQYRETLRLAPNSPLGKSELAWILATCPAQDVRNASEAVSLAEEANRMTGYRAVEFLDILGAACASVGRFDRAIAVARAALDAANRTGQSQLAAQIRQRLALYEAGRPFLTPQPYNPNQ
ncbi:MAG: tetratricopeptide repeat protein [Planctomycetota bacterium]|nr:tetratricopeptide repeat protein [Planctomycetota bacterium]